VRPHDCQRPPNSATGGLQVPPSRFNMHYYHQRQAATKRFVYMLLPANAMKSHQLHCAGSHHPCTATPTQCSLFQMYSWCTVVMVSKTLRPQGSAQDQIYVPAAAHVSHSGYMPQMRPACQHTKPHQPQSGIMRCKWTITQPNKNMMSWPYSQLRHRDMHRC
jgi:hypothetical protein